MAEFTRDAIDTAAAALELAEPSAVLDWVVATFGDGASLATGFGAEGCVLIHLVAERRLPIEIFTLDTGLLFPETYELWQRLEARYGITIRGVRPVTTLDAQRAVHGDRLWEREPNRCCEIRKVAPLAGYLATRAAWITAIRREQTPERATAGVVEWDRRFALPKINPLARWTARDVWRFVGREQVPVNALHDRGFASIGCVPCTTDVAPGEDPRAGRWRGRAKTECGLHVLRPVDAARDTVTS